QPAERWQRDEDARDHQGHECAEERLEDGSRSPPRRHFSSAYCATANTPAARGVMSGFNLRRDAMWIADDVSPVHARAVSADRSTGPSCAHVEEHHAGSARGFAEIASHTA